jgi:hypothetical protein
VGEPKSPKTGDVCADIEGNPEDALRGLVSTKTDIERRLRDAGNEFIESHRKAATATTEAAKAGMSPDAIAHVSALSPETVAAFLREAGSER